MKKTQEWVSAYPSTNINTKDTIHCIQARELMDLEKKKRERTHLLRWMIFSTPPALALPLSFVKSRT